MENGIVLMNKFGRLLMAKRRVIRLSFIIMMTILIVACKKGDTNNELIKKDTSNMTLLEEYGYYYHIDFTNHTINWYNGMDQDVIYDFIDPYSMNIELSSYNIDIETIHEENVWLRLEKDGYIYGFIKSNPNKKPTIEYYEYMDWQPKIKSGRYKFNPIDEVIFFDNVEVYEGTNNYKEYVMEGPNAALFYSKLFDGIYINNIVTIFKGSDINYVYNPNKGLNYLITEKPIVNNVSLEEIVSTKINFYDYKQFVKVVVYNNEELMDSIKAKENISEINQFVIRAIKNKNFSELSHYINKDKGLRLIPYDRLKSEDAIVSKEYLGNYKKRQYDDTHYFGAISGLGTYMIMGIYDYWDYFLYPVDYIRIEPAYNVFDERSEKFLLNNTSITYYNDPIIVRYNYEVTNKDKDIMNFNKDNRWRSLKLIYENIEGKWYLVMIMNNESTV